MIRSMYGVCMDLHRWSQSRGSPYRALMETIGSPICTNELLLKLNPSAKGRKMHLGHLDDHANGNYYDSGHGMGGGEDDESVVGAETVMDQDTETELHNDLDADDTQVTSFIQSLTCTPSLSHIHIHDHSNYLSIYVCIYLCVYVSKFLNKLMTDLCVCLSRSGRGLRQRRRWRRRWWFANAARQRQRRCCILLTSVSTVNLQMLLWVECVNTIRMGRSDC